MERDTVLRWLSKQPASKWLELLCFAYDEMNQRQREAVFGEAVVTADLPAKADGKRLWRAIGRFQQDSLASRFYAPFNMGASLKLRAQTFQRDFLTPPTVKRHRAMGSTP